MTTAISPSPRKTTSRVCCRIAGMSDATKNSPVAEPTTMGGPLRTATIFSGSSSRDQHEREQAAHQQQRSANARSPGRRPSSPVSTRCATISVSVSVTKTWPCRCSSCFRFEIVLDDAVVDDDDLAGAVAMRVGVFFGGAAVCRPPRVADAVVPGNRIGVDPLLEIRQLAGAAPQVDAGRRAPPPRRPSRSRGTRAAAVRQSEQGRRPWVRCSR